MTSPVLSLPLHASGSRCPVRPVPALLHSPCLSTGDSVPKSLCVANTSATYKINGRLPRRTVRLGQVEFQGCRDPWITVAQSGPSLLCEACFSKRLGSSQQPGMSQQAASTGGCAACRGRGYQKDAAPGQQ